jgi:hypothetical protein
MSFLHVLLAVALALGGVRARLKEAPVENGRLGMLVVHVTISLLLGRPANFGILATGFSAFPWPGVGLFMFRQIARAAEDFVAVTALLIDV